MKDHTFCCTKCGGKYTTNLPNLDEMQKVFEDTSKCKEGGRCELITEQGKEILIILNTLENCTVVDMPDVIRAIKEDTIKKHKHYARCSCHSGT